ncbi:GNAT family N-acetyltransferase [Virgibacillus kekensis]|uniref:GNAT family N-acetyltransferase n=1 Tax=Virgibacillus kekensis TaxID=202261 RepID=A0ABV9DN88_9BACI
MSINIRQLNQSDYSYLETMQTGKDNDYVLQIFDRLITGNNRLFGLFLDNQLVSVGGYSIFAGRYAMLGRLRSDLRFRGNSYASKLMAYMRDEALNLEEVQWVGANTQEENFAARRVMDKNGFKTYSRLHGAMTKDTSALESGTNPWKPIQNLQRKKDWLNKMYPALSEVFPYQCFYPFPVSSDLFQDEEVNQWSFYENETGSRVVIIKEDQKKYHFLQTIYPWEDIDSQPGLWETISREYRDMTERSEDETYIWLDMTKEQANRLPTYHQFKLPSPWILHGVSKAEWLTMKNIS